MNPFTKSGYAVWLVAAAMAASSQASCAPACKAAVPKMVQAQTVMADAQAALIQAQNVIAVSPLSAEQKATADRAIRQAWEGLRKASEALGAGMEACQEPSLKSVFEAFNKAWLLLKPFLLLVGGPGGQEIEDPVAFEYR